MGELISVLIPAYNHERYVEECLRSVMAQTYPNLELLLIDDGSSDATWNIITDLKALLEKRFTRTVILQQENKGISATLTRLRDLSRGEYVFTIASDDMVKSHALELLHGFLVNHPEYIFVVGDNEIIDENSHRVYWDSERNNVRDPQKGCFLTFADFFRSCRRDVRFDSDDFGEYSSLLRGNYIPNGYLIRGELFRNAGLFNVNAPLEDWYMLMQLSKLGKLKFINQITFSYRWHNSNISKNAHKMAGYTTKSMQLEICNIAACDNEKLKSIMDTFLYRSSPERQFLRIGNIFRFYRTKGWQYKMYILEIYGRSILSIRRERKR